MDNSNDSFIIYATGILWARIMMVQLSFHYPWSMQFKDAVEAMSLEKIPSAVKTGPGQEEKKIGGKIPFPLLIIVILKHRNNGSLHDYIRRILDGIFDDPR